MNSINSECILWLGTIDNKDYGSTRYKGKPIGAHRRAWIWDNGPIPDGLCVLHKCDTPACINVAHLSLGTKGDNNTDRSSKGRSAKGYNHGSYTHPEKVARGDKHGSRTHPEKLARGNKHYSRTHPEKRVKGSKIGISKLIEENIREIRNLRSTFATTLEDLGKQFGVHKTTIGRVLSCKTWTHVI